MLGGVVAVLHFRNARNEPDGLAIEDAARYACYAAIDRMAPTSYAVDFEIEDVAHSLRRNTDGTIELQIKFTAKNALKSSSAAIAYCVVSGDGQRVERIRLGRAI
ncbi:hypothetical protein ACU4GD_28125 [Cupriavidus basilensis]